MNAWPWNKRPDTQSQWETCLWQLKQLLEKNKNLEVEKQELRQKLYPNTVEREQFNDPMQPKGTKTGEERSPYGYCPHCKAKGITRQRRPNGDDTCGNGHIYPSKYAKQKP